MNTRTFLRYLAPIVTAIFLFATMGLAVPSINARPFAPPGPSQENTKYEPWLNQQVHHRLATLPWYGIFDNIEYQIRGHEVILTGQVVRPVTKIDAQDSLKGIEGVRRVVNRIEVLPPSPFDNQIRLAEYRSLFFRGSPLFYYSLGVNPGIHIIVDNGHVTLVGIVNSEADRNLATMRARLVPNVFSVTNHLRVA